MGEMTDEEILKWWSEHAPSLAPGTPTRTLAEMIDRTVSALREKVGKKKVEPSSSNGWASVAILRMMEKWEPSDVARSIYRDAASEMEAELKKAEEKKVDPPISLESLEERLRAGGRLSWKESEYVADILNRVRYFGVWNFGFPK